MVNVQPREASCGQNRYAISDQGAHVTRWTSAAFGDVLYLSSKAELAPGRAIRGGVPICFPWFAAGPDGDRSPSHGFARTSPWRCTGWTLDETACRLEATYELASADVGGAAGEFIASYFVTIDPNEATLRLRITNTGSAPYHCEAALHTYFAVSDASAIAIDGLDGVTYIDKTENMAVRQQVGPVRFDGEVDRIYQSTADVVLDDPALSRSLRIAKSGAPQTVVWNPGKQKAAALSDVGEGEWRSFVCVEAGAVGTDAIVLAPGEHHDLEQRITVSHL